MEQRKSDINTGDGNVVNVDTNGLSYSFDFSSQVDNTPQVAPVQSEAAPQVAPVQPEVAPQVAPVQPEAAPQAAPVQSEVAQQAAPVQSEVAPQAAPVQPVAAQQVESVQPQEIQTEQVQATEENVTGEDLIKDKKSTKVFLFVLFALVVAFIICLPLLYDKIGNIG